MVGLHDSRLPQYFSAIVKQVPRKTAIQLCSPEFFVEGNTENQGRSDNIDWFPSDQSLSDLLYCKTRNFDKSSALICRVFYKQRMHGVVREKKDHNEHSTLFGNESVRLLSGKTDFTHFYSS